jgi:hypothetical protein
MQHARNLVVILAIQLAGCSAPASPDVESQTTLKLPIRTERTSYAPLLHRGFVPIVATYTNISEGPIHVELCDGKPAWILERRATEGWMFVGAVPCSAGSVAELSAGAARTDSLAVPFGISKEPSYYRLVYLAYSSAPHRPEHLLPIEERSSNVFEIAPVYTLEQR